MVGCLGTADSVDDLGLTVVGLLVSWTLLATVYFLPAWLVGFYANRDLNLRGSWKLAGAALLPGTLFMTLAILLYGLSALDLVQLAAAGIVHLVVGWIYLVAAIFLTPKIPSPGAGRGNPFTEPAGGKAGAGGAESERAPGVSGS